MIPGLLVVKCDRTGDIIFGPRPARTDGPRVRPTARERAAERETRRKLDELAEENRALTDRLLYAESLLWHLADALAIDPSGLPDALAPRLFVPTEVG